MLYRPRLSRWRSIDSLQGGRYNYDGSRSPSPAPSSSMESHSIKDSPIQLDHDTVSDGGYSDMAELCGGREEPKSVMAGGAVKVCLALSWLWSGRFLFKMLFLAGNQLYDI